MSLKITIEKVDNGATVVGVFQPKLAIQTPDSLPVELIVKEGTTGLDIATLKQFLTMAHFGKMNTAITAMGGSTLANGLVLACQEHTDALV
jgi:phage baseplate assembly protein gpV